MEPKKFTILHSNDMHGDFLAEAQGENGKLIGGLALLSGYINQVRKEEENVIYTISGDMVQGSMIDAEFKGISTMEIMNYLAPDLATLGNQELYFGLPHLLFLEKMANFPIVNANLYIKKYNKRLMQPYTIKQIAGLNIMFIGILTVYILSSIKNDMQICTFISLEDSSTEVVGICDAYKNEDIDLTILLTHIGFESDKELAAMLKTGMGSGSYFGRSLTYASGSAGHCKRHPDRQANVGTDQIGRFDIVVDVDTNRVAEWKWQLVPIISGDIQPDASLQKFIDSYREVVDAKYNTLICRTAQTLTHPRAILKRRWVTCLPICLPRTPTVMWL